MLHIYYDLDNEDMGLEERENNNYGRWHKGGKLKNFGSDWRSMPDLAKPSKVPPLGDSQAGAL